MATKTVSIKRKPSMKVTNLTTPSRDGTKFSSSWKIPSGVTNQNDPSRWQRVRAKLRIQTMDKKYVRTNNANLPAKDVKDTVVNDQTGASLTSISKTLTRKDYYPLTSRLIKQVYASVWAHNSKGYGPENKSGMYWIDFPPKPTVAVSYDKDTGVTTYNLKYSTSNSNTVRAERYDTKYIVEWESKSSPGWHSVRDGSSTSTDFNVTYDSPAASTLRDGEWIDVRITAYNRGLRGDSEYVTKTKTICPPAVYNVSSITKSGSEANGFVHVYTKSAAGKHTVVDQVQLQRLRNVELSTIEAAAASTDWEDVAGAVDNSNTKGLTDAYQDAVPERGNHTWYRFKTTHDNYVRYSQPMEATVLYKALLPVPPELGPGDDYPVIVSMDCEVGSKYDEAEARKVGVDDPAVILTVALWLKGVTPETYSKNVEVHSTGIEVSWSEREYAWSSNSEPNSYELSFSNGDIFPDPLNLESFYSPDSDPSKYYLLSHKGVARIYELEPTSDYYFKLRTYNDDEDGNRTYGPYVHYYLPSEDVDVHWPYRMANFDKTTLPQNLEVYAPSFIRRGETIPVTWTFSSEDDILETEVLVVDDTVGAPYKDYQNQNATTTSTVILANDIPVSTRWMDVLVNVRNRYGWNDSTGNDRYNVARILVVDLPEISVTASTPLTQQPYGFRITVTKNHDALVENFKLAGLIRAVAKITCDGVVQQLPNGELVQAEGDVVWAGNLGSLDWHYSEDSQEKPYADFSFPESLTLVDGGSYTLEVYLESDVTTTVYGGAEDAHVNTGKPSVTEKYGTIKSGVVKQKFTVNWSHKAKPPQFDECKAVGTSNGKTLTAKILPTPSPGTLKTDVVDVYRVTPDGAYPIAIGARFGSYVTDTLAPFSKTANLRYRLATRTRDGDISWIDVPYSLKHYPIRFDWGDGRFLEVPFNIKMNDSFEKDFEDRQHLNGGHPGYWNPGVKRTSSLSTQLIRIDLYNVDPLVKASDPEGLKELLRELAHYAGPVFVRTPDGCAYPANVSVSGIDSSYDSLVLDVSFDATEVDMTSEFQVESRNMTASAYTPTSSVAQSYTYKKGAEQRYKLMYAPSEGVVRVDFTVKDTNQTTKASKTTTVETLQASYDLTREDDGFYYVTSSDLAWNAALKKLDDYQSEYGANGKLAKTVKITYK